jgi:hypothetical protein
MDILLGRELYADQQADLFHDRFDIGRDASEAAGALEPSVQVHKRRA